MSLWNLKTRTRLTLAEMLARVRRTLRDAEGESTGRVLDLSEMEDRVLMSAAPAAVVAQVADVAPMNPSAGNGNSATTGSQSGTSSSTASPPGQSPASAPGLSANDHLDFVLMSVDQSLSGAATDAATAPVQANAVDLAKHADAASLLDVATPADKASSPVSMEMKAVDAAATSQPVVPDATVRHELVFLDPQIADYQKLANDIWSANDPTRQIELVLLSSQRDGIEQITQTLAEHHNLDAIHILSHGVDGALELGRSWLNGVSLDARAGEIAQWSNSLTPNGDILLYGCNVAADAQGQAFVDRLADLTGADVAASRDATGSAILGGNWNLEYHAGAIETEVAIDRLTQQAWNSVFAITIDNTTSNATAGAGASSLTWSHTVNSGSNGILVVQVAVHQSGANETVSSVAYGGQALTLIGTVQDAKNEEVELWSLVAPNVGTANIVVNVSGATTFAVGATDYLGVDQSAPLGTLTSASGKSATPTVTVTSAAGELVIDTVSVQGDMYPISPSGAGQTQLWNADSGGHSGGDAVGGGSSQVGAASVTMSWTVSKSNNWAIGAVSLHQATNNAPVLDATKSPVLTAQNEDSGAPSGAVGTRVSSLVNLTTPVGGLDNVTDTDAAAVTGIAVTGTDNAHGTWFYSTNNGGTWAAMGAMSDASARVLAADVNTRIYFQPNADFNGTLANAMTFRAWDETTDTNGALANASINGGTTAFSAVTDTASLNVNAVNDAPTLAGWYNSAWSYRKEIVIDHTQVSGGQDLSNFTMLVDLGSDANLAAHALANGNDILFTSADGTTKLSHEIETFVSASGHLLAWVNVPTVFAASDTVLYMYYGDAVAPNQQDAAGTWGSSYAGVWHLDQTSTGAAGEFTDSTANNNSGQGTGGPLSVAGMFGNGQDFNGTSNFISVPNSSSLQLTSVMTLEGWINSRTFGSADDVDAIVRKGDANPNNYQLALFNAQPTIQLDQSEGGGLVASTTVPANTWHHIVGTWDGTTRSIYMDGVLLSTDTYPAPIGTDLRDLYIGGRIGNTDTVDGVVDEVRVETVARSAGWIATEYNNATAPGSFSTLSSEQSYPTALTVTLTGTNEDTPSTGTTADSILTASGANDIDAGAIKGLAITSKTGNGTWQYSTDGASWSNFGAVSASNALLISSTTQVRYVPDGINGETATFGFVAWDQTSDTASTNGSPSHANPGAGGGSTAYSSRSSSASMTITSINDAPVLTLPAPQNVNEDASLTFSSGNGNQIAISDVDAGISPVQFTLSAAGGTLTLNGVAGLTFLSGDGTADPSMQFTGTISAINNALNGMSFSPTANFNGGAGLGFVVSDLGNSGSGGAQTANGGLGITVNSVNDAPAGADKTVTTLEDTVYTFAASDFSVTDPNDSPANTLAGVKITTLPGAGSLTDNGAAVSAGQTVLLADITGGLLRFTPAANANGANYASFTFQVQDNGGIANGGVNLDQTPNLMTINVTSVNDAPTATIVPTSYTVNEQTTLVLHGTGLSVNDVDAGNAAINMTLSVGAGVLNISAGSTGVSVGATGTNSVLVIGTLTQLNDLLAGNLGGSVTYLNSSDTPPPSTTLTLLINDGGVSGLGGALSGSDTATINIVSINDAPTATNLNAAETYTEDTPLNLVDIVISDVDSANVTATLTLSNNAAGSLNTATSGAVTSTYNAGTGVWSASGAIANVNTLLAGLTFTPTLNFNSNFTIATSVSDGSLSVTGSKAMTGIAVNDAPIMNAGGPFAAINEDNVTSTGTLVSTLASGITDVDAGAVKGIAVTTVDNSNGSWQYTLDGTTWLAVGSVTPSSALLLPSDAVSSLRFVPNANWWGNTGLTTLRAWDQTSGTAGGFANVSPSGGTTAFSSGAVGLALTVKSVNDAPAGTSNTVTTLEDTAFTFTPSSFGFTDANDSPANTLTAVKITTLPVVGTLTDNGSAVTIGQSISLADISGGLFQFTPVANANGTNYDSFTFQVQDNGGTANGGMDLAPSPNTMTINVTAVNDAPTNGVPGTQTVAEDTPLVFSAANGNTISVSDVDVGSGLLGVRLTVANGTLTLGSTANLSFGLGNGINNRDMIFAGTAADVNAALASLTYMPDANFNGNETLTIQTRDFGSSGSGGEQFAKNLIAIVVTPVNDPPVASDDSYSVKQAESLTVAAPGVMANDHDVDSTSLTVVLVTGPAHGSLKLNADGSFTYTPAGVFYGTDGFTYQIHDGIAAGNLATVKLTVIQTVGGGGTGGSGSGSGGTSGGGNTNPGGGGAPSPGPLVIPSGVPIASGGSGNSGPSPTTTPTISVVTPTFNPIMIEQSVWQYLSSSRSDRSRLGGLLPSDSTLNALNAAAAMDRILVTMFDDNGAIWSKLDDLRRDFEQDVQTKVQSLNLVVRTTAAVGSSLTVGYVLWLLRGGTLIASMVSALPAWTMIDPLPILDTYALKRDDDDDESLSSLIEGSGLDKTV